MPNGVVFCCVHVRSCGPPPRTDYTPKSHVRTFFPAWIFSTSAERSIGQLYMGVAGKGGTKKCVYFKRGISAIHADEW